MAEAGADLDAFDNSAAMLATLARCREQLLPGGRFLMHVSFFGAAVLATSGTNPVLEHESVDPRTGHRIRIYDGRTVDRIEQIQHSINQIHELDDSGNVLAVHRSETHVRWIQKPELELLLRAAGFTHWTIAGGFDGKPLPSEEDQMIVTAWNE